MASSSSNPLSAAEMAAAQREYQLKLTASSIKAYQAHSASLAKATTRSYSPRQAEWRVWCESKRPGMTDGDLVSEEKLSLYLQEAVIDRKVRVRGKTQHSAPETGDDAVVGYSSVEATMSALYELWQV